MLRRQMDGSEPEPVSTGNTVTVSPDGPVYLRGNIELVSGDGSVLLRDTRIALCRCGASKNKPLCDGQHTKAGFSDAGSVQVDSDGDGSEGGRLTAKVLPSGPVSLNGSFRVVDSSGAGFPRRKAALCRCGESENKPFCDGTHVAIDFEAD
jgi:CDGSH-type Zn-finger protein